ncbi:Amino acid transporter protein 6 [Caenorhabditis elegans]|nr:Amino acid transporter protein 6 [Caenorhabditis elegans]CAQ35057.1 Amino acid transporter protein 6 [Caenorhabditis elegans]|eukprot:NP_001123014.1 Amino Acid Transporter [Caenorhabditis elegans]
MPDDSRSQKMGLLGAISYIVGNIVGSGIFITPTSIIENVNSVGLSLAIWILAAFISMLGSFCYVELGTSIRLSGGDFAYLCFMKWYPVAFAFMCIGCTINYPATLAVQAQTFAEYVFRGAGVELDETSEFWAKKLLGFSLIILLMFMNFFSLKTFVQRFSILASLAKIAATLLIIITGFYYLIFKHWKQNLEEPFKGSNWNPGPFVNALFAGLFSYDGWDILNFGAEEIENPKRTMPLSIIIGMTCIGVIYVAVNVAYSIVLSPTEMIASNAVAIDFANKTLGAAAFVVPVMVAILLIGSLNSTMFSASRYLQAVSRQGHIPSAISGIAPNCDSPRVALLVHILIAIAVSFLGDPDKLINYVAFAQWSQRAFTMSALLYLRIRGRPRHPDRIQLPIIMPILFFLVCTSMVVISIIDDFKSSAVGLGILLGGLIIFIIFVWDRALPSSHTFRNATHVINEESTKFMQIIFNVVPERVGDEEMKNAIGGAESESEKVPAYKISPTGNGQFKCTRM